MDINEYIASGIIESYVLGSLQDQERREVECMSSIYPEIKEQITLVQKSIESMALKGAIDPPSALKTKILTAINQEEQVQPQAKEEPVKARIIPMQSTRSKSLQLYRIASIGLILLFSSLLIFLFIQKNQWNNQQKELSEKLETLKEQNKSNATLLADYKLIEQFLSSGNTNEILLSGTDRSPESKVSVYYNKDEQKAIFTTSHLPQTDDAHQFQLWALVDGVPHDLGVFEIDDSIGFAQPVNVTFDNIQAFAITLEKRGGSPTPNLEELYVIGNI